MQPYSPERRTALVFCGTGAHGAYHAGVLRALQEAGVKIDVMAGQGVGAASAALAAIDGGARLWDPDGVWRGRAAETFYRWRWPLRAAGWMAAALALAVVALGAAGAFGWPVPAALPIVTLALGAALVVVVVLGDQALERGAAARRRATGPSWWRLLGAPLDVARARQGFAETLWQLLRGAARETRPPAPELGRRYAEVLAENLSQPGFRELMVVVTDLDARHDVVAALLREPHQREFIAARPGRERRAEAIDLAGSGRDHTADLISAALTPPLLSDPQRLTFGADSYWRGETHRLCDRPGACARLLEELAAAGVTQVVMVSAVAASQKPHRLRASRLQLQHRLGDLLAAAEAAALRDALDLARLRFDSIYVIAPAHNPIGAFDVTGAYDEASDRRQDLMELMARAYEDAYHQFIEPVVGASGERLAHTDTR